jgi:hypothetical protein
MCSTCCGLGCGPRSGLVSGFGLLIFVAGAAARHVQRPLARFRPRLMSCIPSSSLAGTTHWHRCRLFVRRFISCGWAHFGRSRAEGGASRYKAESYSARLARGPERAIRCIPIYFSNHYRARCRARFQVGLTARAARQAVRASMSEPMATDVRDTVERVFVHAQVRRPWLGWSTGAPLRVEHARPVRHG